jgi:hypothetical protein
MEGLNLALMPNHSTKPILIKRMNYNNERFCRFNRKWNRVWLIYWNGTIAQFVSKKAKKVKVSKVFLMLSRDAKANAVRNNIDNCEFYVGDMKVVLMILLLHNTDNLMLSLLTHRETECTKMWRTNCPPKIVYVSCKLSYRTWFSQWQILAFRVRPVDTAPHVENVVLLEDKIDLRIVILIADFFKI